MAIVNNHTYECSYQPVTSASSIVLIIVSWNMYFLNGKAPAFRFTSSETISSYGWFKAMWIYCWFKSRFFSEQWQINRYQQKNPTTAIADLLVSLGIDSECVSMSVCVPVFLSVCLLVPLLICLCLCLFSPCVSAGTSAHVCACVCVSLCVCWYFLRVCLLVPLHICLCVPVFLLVCLVVPLHICLCVCACVSPCVPAGTSAHMSVCVSVFLRVCLLVPLRVMSRSRLTSVAGCDECSLDVKLGDVLFDSLQ